MAEVPQFLQITITDTAYEVASKFVEDGWFDSANEACKFAAAYAIRHHFDKIKPESLYYPRGSHNYGYSSFDPDGSWEKIIKILYNTDRPREYFRNLIIWGLEDMGQKIKESGRIQITDFL